MALWMLKTVWAMVGKTEERESVGGISMDERSVSRVCPLSRGFSELKRRKNGFFLGTESMASRGWIDASFAPLPAVDDAVV